MTIDGLPDDIIAFILNDLKSFAVVGASDKPERPSYGVMAFLLRGGRTVHPVNPGLAGNLIHGRAVHARLADVPAPVDVVDVFRKSEDALGVVNDAISERDRLAIKVVWMQLGVINHEAARLASEAGLIVVMDRCPKIEAARLRIA